MYAISLDPICFSVEHDGAAGAAGPSLRVWVEGRKGRELLRFDCSDRDGRWCVDPGGREQVSHFATGVDPLEWTLSELHRDLEGLLRRAGFSLEKPFEPGRRAAALAALERALRNPPLDLDGVEPAVRRAGRGEKWRTYAEDVLPVWVADMDFPIAEPIRRVLLRAAESSNLGYPIHPAPTDVPEIVVSRMRERFAWSPDAECVEILTDVVQGMYVALQQFSEPGDGVVVQTPIYPPFLAGVRSMKRRLLATPLSPGPEGYAVDLDALRAAAEDGARVLLLCNPHNPSGRVFRRGELEGIAEIAVSSGLVVVSDEIHADLVYPGHEHVPFAALSPEVAARTITLSAASKAFNVAGLRCAVAVFGTRALKRRFCELPRHLRGGIGLLGIEALRAAWRHGQPWLDQVLAYLGANRDLLAEFVADELDGVCWHPPEATYLGWLDCRALALEPDPYSFFLKRARVALSDGSAFGEPGRGFVRINFGTSRAILCDALERMATALRERG